MLIPTSFEHLSPKDTRSSRRSCRQLLRCSYCCRVVEHRAGTNRSFKNFIRISALAVLATSFDFIGPPIRIALESFLIAGRQIGDSHWKDRAARKLPASPLI